MNNTILNRIRKRTFLEEITEEEYKKASPESCNIITMDDDSPEYEYFKSEQKDPSGKIYHHYYKVPKLSSEETKLYLLQHIAIQTKQTEARIKTIEYIIVFLFVFDIIAALLSLITR